MSLLHRPRILQVFPPARQSARAVDCIGIEWLLSRPSVYRSNGAVAAAIAATGPDCVLELTLLSEGMRAAGIEGSGAPSGPLYVRTGILGALGIPGGRYEVLGLRLGAAGSASGD